MGTATRAAGVGLPHDTNTPDVHTSSAEYRRRFEGGGRLALVRQSNAVMQLLRTTRTGDASLSVLDVGGGHAQLTELLCRAGHRVVVHGSAPECFGFVAPLARAHPDRIAPCVSRLLALPFADGTFDLVCAIRLMAHTTEWRALLAEMARVSRRFLLVDFPLYAGAQRFAGRFFALKKKVEANTRPFFLYRRREVDEELTALGMRAVGSVGQLVLPLALHRALRAPGTSLLIERALAGTGLAASVGSPVLLLSEHEKSPRRPEIPRSARNDTVEDTIHHEAQEIRT